MSQKVNIGGGRLGSGAKMETELNGYARSNHDLSYLWKSSMSAGTLVPFMSMVALPGDTFDIDLECIVKTLPTVGPLFGSFKVQLDVFKCPIRLYNSALHNNKLGVGMDMSKFKLPRVKLRGKKPTLNSAIPIDNQQINPSSLLSYLGYKGIASWDGGESYFETTKQAVPIIAYWDIFKNYYANKQEVYHYVISAEKPAISSTAILPDNTLELITSINIYGTNITPENLICNLQTEGNDINIKLTELFQNVDIIHEGRIISAKNTNPKYSKYYGWTIKVNIETNAIFGSLKPRLQYFELTDIDEIRESILSAGSEETCDVTNLSPIRYMLRDISDDNTPTGSRWQIS